MINNFKELLAMSIFIVSAAVAAQAQQVFVANLSGSQEVPAVSSAGKGVCQVVLNAAQTQISVNCNYSGLSSSANAGHIHGNGVVGATAPVLFNFGTVSGVSGTITPSPFAVTAQQVADLRANKMYVNIHTANNPNGEIRGQLHVTNSSFDDYDGDGRADITVFRPSTGTWFSQSSINGSSKTQAWGASSDITALNADFDGDGLADYAAIRPNLTNGSLTTYILQSASNTMRSEQFGSALTGDQIGTGDFDGDGKYDLGVFRGGAWYYIESSTGTVRYVNWGQSGDIPAQGDFDRDGKSDFAVVRTVSGAYVWYIRLSSNGQTRVVQFGQSGDTALNRSDYDGDGASDITVVRNNGGSLDYYTLRSSDGQTTTFRWGLSTDTFRIGDFDGDGKGDYISIRNQNGTLFWYIFQSSNNQLRVVQWGATGDK